MCTHVYSTNKITLHNTNTQCSTQKTRSWMTIQIGGRLPSEHLLFKCDRSSGVRNICGRNYTRCTSFLMAVQPAGVS